jgi:hypothetical protein
LSQTADLLPPATLVPDDTLHRMGFKTQHTSPKLKLNKLP